MFHAWGPALLLKAAMLIGAAALAGAGLARFWLLADLASAWPPGSGGSTVGVPGPGGAGAAARSAAGRAVRLLALGGLVVLVAGSLADLRAALLAIFPTADWSLTWRYALTSGHGAAVQVRVALALALAGLVLLPAAGREVLPAFVIGALGLFATFSVISHGAVMGGWLPLVSDLVHFAAAGAWAGAVFALVLAPLWDEGALRGLSRMGLLAVIVLAATGTLSALVHAGEPERFLASSYASALLVKLAIVVATVGLAAANRFVFLPRFVAGQGGRSLRAALRLETVLLLGVLVATGWLTTTAVPHGSEVSVQPFENAGRLLDHLLR